VKAGTGGASKVSAFHCSCGFAIDDADEFGDHIRLVFARDDDIGTDGQVHADLAGGPANGHQCACGLTTTDLAEFDDHLLIVFVTLDGIGTDGERHVPVDTATPDRWHVRKFADDD
jgi:hypothetical protein